MNIRRVSGIALLAVLATIALFEVEPAFDVALSGETLLPDPAVEWRYANCYREKDDEIHTIAFSTIDNPDVQKEFISSNRARAARECRELHPQAMISVSEPARFNLFDLQPRFW